MRLEGSWMFAWAMCALAGAATTTVLAATATTGTTAAATTTAATVPAQYGPLYANLHGEVVLDNPRVYVQKFILLPGQATGRRSLPGDQLQVFIKGGVLTSSSGRATVWKD